MSTTVVAEFLARRTAHGFTATFEAIPTQPLVLHYYDEVFQSKGITASNHRTLLTPGTNHALDEARACV